jgi:hypothetical protein
MKRNALPLNSNLSELMDAGVRRMQGFVEAHARLAEVIQEANATWVQRVRVEAGLASDLATKLSASPSPTEALEAWQDWANRRMALMAEDAAQLTRVTQDFLQAGVQTFTGWALPVDTVAVRSNGRHGGPARARAEKDAGTRGAVHH